jgi:hypothetical protein
VAKTVRDQPNEAENRQGKYRDATPKAGWNINYIAQVIGIPTT